jgi:hypothetical protein
MSLLPIADCLVIEHRQCQCKLEYICPAPCVHRLLATPAGEPRKLILRPRHDDEFAMEISTIHTVLVEIPHCPICWADTHPGKPLTWMAASTLVPKRPLADEMGLLFSDKAINEEIRNALIKAGIRVPQKDGAAKTDYEKALEL